MAVATEVRRTDGRTGEEKPLRVCFVCTGNTCRSPMAEAVLNALIQNNERRDLCAYSAGLFANEGEPIAENAILALEAAEIPTVTGRDYRRHTAHTLSGEEAERTDLFVAMTNAHAMQLLMRFPDAADRITVMPNQISDPYGGDAARYRDCLSEIRAGVQALFAPEESV